MKCNIQNTGSNIYIRIYIYIYQCSSCGLELLTSSQTLATAPLYEKQFNRLNDQIRPANKELETDYQIPEYCNNRV